MTTDQYIIGEWDRIEKARGPILAGDTESVVAEIAKNTGTSRADVQTALLWKWLAPT